MRFAFTEEQLELRQAVRQVLQRECTPDDVRAAYQPSAGGAPAADGHRWGVLRDLGVPGLLAPAAVGGLGLDEVDLVAVAEEAGRVALPEPIGVVAGVMVPVLAGLVGSTGRTRPERDATDARTWLDRLVRGEAIGALGGIDARSDQVEVTTTTEDQRGATTPHGASGTDGPAHPWHTVVVGGGWADVLLLACPGGDGPALHLVPVPDTTTTSIATLDPTRRVLAVRWRPSAATVVAEGPDAARAIEEIVCRSALVGAAELLGLTDTMISTAADYARVRRQFGKPIGSFQAVKHLLANARVRLEFARPVLYRAAWSMGHLPPSQVHDCSMALAMAAEAADGAARAALQVHGAIGYTWECDLHMWMKRTWALTASGQVERVHRARVLAAALQRNNDPERTAAL